MVTVHGRGYKYAGPHPVEIAAPVAVGKPSLQGENAGLDRKPVIAVLPLDNLSGDPEQQYFSDGITGDIIDRLTRFRAFAVIGQNSAAAFRATTPDFAAIREKLKATFVVTGSVRRAGGRLRIAVRLSDSASAEAIWAEHYDRPASDLFSLQDEISELVASTVARHLEVEINVRSTSKPHGRLSSYEHMLQGYWHFKKLTREGCRKARDCFEQAVALDPRNAEALGWLGVAYCESWVEDFSVENAVKGVEIIGQAVALDPANAHNYAFQAWALLCVPDLEGALRASERSIALAPGDPMVLVNRALTLVYDGNCAGAQTLFAQARRLEPIPPLWFGEFEGVAAFAEGRYADCLAGVEPIPEIGWDIMYALACYGHLGRRDRASDILGRLKNQGTQIDFLFGAGYEPYRDPDCRERLIAGLKTALSY